jgi:aminobenzoyl-glutamate utilization protein B
MSATGSPGTTGQATVDWIEANRQQITDLSDRLWLYAEPSLQEHRSAAFIVKTLRAAGFHVEEGVAGLDTAFVATWGEGAPVICSLAEYEAVEDSSQMPVPYRQPVLPGLAGCYDMHHGLAAGAVGAALAVKEMMQRHRLRGTFKLFGTPAEKTAIGKNIMAREGLFEGLDACVSWHPSNETSADRFISQQIRCNNQTSHTFEGVSAYNATPWGARNAHHAAELMDVAVQFIKDTIIPVSSLPTISSVLDRDYVNHAVSSVPGEARAIYVSRALTRKENEQIQKRLFDCADAAALALGVKVTNEVITGTWEPIPNLTLALAAHRNIEAIGPPAFTADDIDYGRMIQELMGQETTATPFGDMSIVPPGVRAVRNVMATTDTTVFCYKCPYVMVTTNYLGAWGWPNWATISYGLSNIAHQSFLCAAKIIATTVLDLFQDPALLAKARDEWKKRVAGKAWYSVIPAQNPAPKPPRLPDAHYRAVVDAWHAGPKWQGWEPALSTRMNRIAQDVLQELG